MIKRLRYFCYGSNLNVSQMKQRCPGARPMSAAILDGYRLEFQGNASGCGYCTVEPDKGKRTQGGLWSITEQDLKRLDFYEGFPTLYRRINVPVQTEFGVEIAMTYQMTAGHPLAMPTDWYVNVCLDGYEDFELDKRAFRAAIRSTRTRIDKQPAFMGWHKGGTANGKKKNQIHRSDAMAR